MDWNSNNMLNCIFHPLKIPLNSLFSLNFILRLVLILSVVLQAFPCMSAATSQDDAVQLARSGRYSEAIEQLKILHQQQPENKKIINDLIVTYCWNNQFKIACSLFENNLPQTYPTYVQIPVLRAYRNLHQIKPAFALVEILLAKQPDDPNLLLYKGLLLVDKHQLKPARVILDKFNNTTGKDSNYYRLSGYLHAAEEKWLAALADYQRLSKLLPGNKAAIREQFSALQYARAQYAAGLILLEKPILFSPRERALLLINQGAEKLRWSTDASRDFEETKSLAMQALALQISALNLMNAEQFSTPILYDIIVTLRNLRQMENVISVYQYLIERGEVPNYVKQAAAGALLANQQPDQSHEIYQQILDTEPANYQANIGLFYSLVEEENFDDAYKLIDSLRDSEPEYQASKNKKSRSYNTRYLDLHVYSILARFYGDQLEKAWPEIDVLVHNAPANNWLLEVRGQTSNARQWYRQALYDFHYASLLAPESLDAQAGEIASLINLKQYRKARPLLEKFKRHHPDAHAAQRLQKSWNFSRKPEYWADIIFANSSGPELDGNGITASAEVLSSPINDNLYIDALYRYAWSEIIEGEETFQRYSIGLDYHLTDWIFLGRLTANDSTLDETGGKIKAIWDPDDFWYLTLSGERFSIDTPLRALHHKIRSDAVSATMNYRWSEQRDLLLSIQGATFTDNNDRIAGSAVFRQRLIDIPHIDVDGRIEMYGSANSRRETFYFNPERDFSLQGALHLDHLYYRHYDDLLAQQIDVAYGFYDQKGYDSRWIGHIRYEQRYKFTPRVEMLAGIEFGQNVYDGHAEPYRLVRFMINGKF